MAADIVQGLTGSADGIDKLKGALDKQLLPNLFRLVPAADADLSRAALVSLVNLSQVWFAHIAYHLFICADRANKSRQSWRSSRE